MTEHILKTWPHFFNDVVSGEKKNEVREADRNFAVGDVLVLREWDASSNFSGREERVVVTHMHRSVGIVDGWVMMSIEKESEVLKRQTAVKAVLEHAQAISR